jgi:hypothetical protein
MPAHGGLGFRLTVCVVAFLLAAAATETRADGGQDDAFHINWGAGPETLAQAVRGVNVVVLARLESIASEDYAMPVRSGTIPYPSTVYRVVLLETFRNQTRLFVGRGEHVIRRHGYDASAHRGGVDASFPQLVVGGTYVFFVNVSAYGTPWAAYGPEGVYAADVKGHVVSSGHGIAAQRQRGISWTSFLERLRSECRKAIQNRK